MGGPSALLNLFAVGSEVQVSTDEEGLKGVWYAATVVEPLSRSASKKKRQNHGNIYVEYHTLLADGKGSKPLRDHVNVTFVRPSPPPETLVFGQSFELNDVVDAFYRDGWWTGVIAGVLGESRFMVTFQNPPDEIEFGISELRVHRQWVDGKWVRPEKQVANQLEGGGESRTKKRRGRPPKLLAKSPTASVADSKDVPAAKPVDIFENDCLMKEVGTAIDNLPLLTWFEGKHSQTTVDGSGVSLDGTVEESTEVTKRQREIGMQSPAVDCKSEILAGENESLPFVKNTPLWRTIESMEVFRMIPQKPHFRALNSCKESTREGLAIGSMVTFSTVVERTPRLQLDDPRNIFVDDLETLVELKSHGFDVKAVQDRLSWLLLIKDKHEELQGESEELKSEMMDLNHEKSKIDGEIDKIDKLIRELQEKRALAVSMKETNDSEIGYLVSTVESINDGIRNAQIDFKGLAAAPWQVG